MECCKAWLLRKHTLTQTHSARNSTPTHSHAVWASIVFIAPCFHCTKGISIVKSWIGAQWACVCMLVSWCVGASVYKPICAKGHVLMFVNRTILHLSGCLFFPLWSIHRYVLSVRSMSVFVCICPCNKSSVMSQTFATKAPSPRSTRVQAAFVKAMCGVLCAALQWIWERERDIESKEERERGSNNLYRFSRKGFHLMPHPLLLLPTGNLEDIYLFCLLENCFLHTIWHAFHGCVTPLFL